MTCPGMSTPRFDLQFGRLGTTSPRLVTATHPSYLLAGLETCLTWLDDGQDSEMLPQQTLESCYTHGSSSPKPRSLFSYACYEIIDSAIGAMINLSVLI